LNHTTGNKGSPSPELLAKYCNLLLKKSNKAEENEIEEKLTEVVRIINS
jgi:hypothetical protein